MTEDAVSRRPVRSGGLGFGLQQPPRGILHLPVATDVHEMRGSMRFIHTSDWHLGRLFFNTHLTSDQAHVLDQLVDLTRDSRVDAVLVSGDVYDRAVPPAEAVQLLDDTLGRLVLDVGVTVVIIAGNHDSPERLSFGSRVLAERGLHVAGLPDAGGRAVVLRDSHGEVRVIPVPYAEPAWVRTALEDEQVHDHEGALAKLLARFAAQVSPAADPVAPPAIGSSASRSIVMAHAFVAGGAESDSERPLSVGGSSVIDPELFAGHSYVALGHLHRPQVVTPAGQLPGVGGDGSVRYAGSLMKYSFSEADHRKSVSVVDLDGAGRVRVEDVSLTPRRDLRRIRGLFADILAGRGDGLPPRGCDDYLAVALLDREPVFDAMARLREVYPSVLTIERPELSGASTHGAGRDHRRLTEIDLFSLFYRDVTGETLDERQSDVFDRVLQGLHTDLRAEGSR